MRLIIFGSRTWSDSVAIFQDLRGAWEMGFRTLVHGACPSGADYLADLNAHYSFGFRVERHPARWHEYEAAGKNPRKAGPDRNEHMASLGAEAAIGYRMQGESRGTDDMARACERHGIAVIKRGWWL